MCRIMVSGLVALVSLLLVAAPADAAVIVNGDFSSGLTGWTTTGPVSDGGGFAVMTDDLVSGMASLEQAFVISALSQSLSFSYSLSAVPDGTAGSPFPDAFTASLLDPVTFAPILSTPGFTDYFYHDNSGFVDYDPSIVSVSGDTVTVDLSSVAAGTDALIAFDLLLGDDGLTTSVEIDNVEAAGEQVIIPEPASVVIWMVVFGASGLGAVLAQRRRRG